MPDTWYFDVTGPKGTLWVWVRVRDDGSVVMRAQAPLRYYRDALSDARKHGFADNPKFGPPPAQR